MQDIKNSRTPEMRRRMKLLQERGICAFCKEGMNFLEKTELYSGQLWFVTINDAGYEGSVTHVMAVPRRHIRDPEELTLEELHEFFRVVIPWARNELKMEGVAALFRFGRTERTGATIHHLHVHFIEGVDRVDLNHPPVFAVVGFKAGYTPETT